MTKEVSFWFNLVQQPLGGGGTCVVILTSGEDLRKSILHRTFKPLTPTKIISCFFLAGTPTHRYQEKLTAVPYSSTLYSFYKEVN